MKTILSIIIIITSLNFAYSVNISTTPEIFNVSVGKVNNDLFVYMSYDGPYPAGQVQGLPRGKSGGTDYEALVDFTIALRWPSALTITLGSVNNTAGLGILKSGGILSKDGYKYQKFVIGGAAFFQSDFIQNIDFEVFKIPITSQTGSGIIEIAPQGFLPNMPNLQIDYFNATSGAGGVPEIYQYDPPDIIASVTLPVQLTQFNVEKINGNSVKIFWATEFEINNNYYNIECSQDSRSWESIGQVAARGNSKSEVSYEFVDDNIILSRNKDNIFYYRLKIVDLDGQYKYSEIRDVNFGRIKTPDLMIHPNPTNDIINLDLTVFDKNDGPIEINVYDMNGKQVLNRITGSKGLESVDLRTLPANTYNISIKQGELIYNEKVVKVQ
ncbi:MAG: T9SS type A sorting domain-containing protein [Saprospiraceae bacterium]|nr:T9SS type A sorting domain-containing protein [Saprospiraceae bacterium]